MLIGDAANGEVNGDIRRISKDPLVAELDVLLERMNNRAFELEGEMKVIEAKQTENLKTIQDTQRVIEKVDNSVLGIRKEIDNANLMLNRKTGQEREHLKERLKDWESMAVAGEQSVHETVGHLSAAQNENADLSASRQEVSRRLETTQRLVSLLKASRRQRVGDIKHGFLTKNTAKILEFTQITRDALDQLQRCSVQQLAAEQKERQRKESVGHPSIDRPHENMGIRELLAKSDSEINRILRDTREKLFLEGVQEEEDAADDAAVELVSIIFTALQDSAQVRKSNNTYLSRLLGYTRQQLNQL